jgi:hypothetical protein
VKLPDTPGDSRWGSLADVLQQLGSFDDDETIFVAAAPATAETPAFVAPEGSEPPGSLYLLEVYLAREVLDVWRDWRGLSEPSRQDAVDAVVYYAENDAYLPNDDV